MKKKSKDGTCLSGKITCGKFWKITQLQLLMFFITLFQLYAENSYTQQKVSISFKDALIEDVIKEVESQSGYIVVYNNTLLSTVKRVSVTIRDANAVEALNQALKGSGLYCKQVSDFLVISKGETRFTPQTDEKGKTLEGKVMDKEKLPLPGVTVLVKGTTLGGVTDSDGKFRLTLPQEKDVILVFSFVGMKKKEVKVLDNNPLEIILEEDVAEVGEVVVQGVFQKKLSSYTGSAVTATVEEIKKVGSLNLIQALNAIDPSIRIAENLQFGSDPNRIPEITVRGENGFDLRSNADANTINPNAPLYILDGIEVSARQIYDMDINRVESVTSLKDASATSLYGSRGANGVILITTKRPEGGEIRTSFTANYNISTPDLRDYNLMNAREKLEYERLSGIWTSNDQKEQESRDRQYNDRLKEVERGVNTYWLSKPLQTGVNQRYSLSFEGGGAQFRYGIDLRYDSDQGVMKKSGRDRLGLGLNFNYNIGTQLYIYNTVSIEQVKEKNSPYGDFATYARLNPCDRVYNDDGSMIETFYPSVANPLINVKLPNFNRGENLMVQDNLSVDWWVIKGLRARGNIAFTKNVYEKEIFRSPASTEFLNQKEENKKGSYSINNSKDYRIDGSYTLQYSVTYDERHTINLGLGSNFQINNSKESGFEGTGFAGDDIAFIGAATQFAEESSPYGSFDKSKLIGFFGNLNYGYNNRYFLDASYRTDGSSKFGRDSRFAPFWSIGVAWNVHNEKFWGENKNFTLKIRGSLGNTGSVNFSSDQALTTYYYNFSYEYNGVYGAGLYGYGNTKLKWQNTKAYNAGFDLCMVNNRIQFFFDIYSKTTDNLLLPVDVAPSSGFNSYIENVGQSRNNGWEGRLRVTWVDNKPHSINWSTTFAMFHNKNKILRLSNTLQEMNKDALDADQNIGKNVLRQYEEGRSQSALMLVRSVGIDPATGHEVFLKLDGTRTFEYDPTDKIIVGDMLPKAEGTIANNFNWKGFNLYLLFNYRWGGKIYNGTLATKVEGASPYYNADRRALQARWKNPGDDVSYRSITELLPPYQTTRFAFDDNLFSLQSISASYDLPKKYADLIRAERLKVTFATTDVFRLSSVKQERGTSYPFARTYTAGLSVTF